MELISEISEIFDLEIECLKSMEQFLMSMLEEDLLLRKFSIDIEKANLLVDKCQKKLGSILTH